MQNYWPSNFENDLTLVHLELGPTSSSVAGAVWDFFVRPPTLTTGNFKAIWPKDLKILAMKDPNCLKKYAKYQEGSGILKMGFALSKWPHLHRAYLVSVPFILILAVYDTIPTVRKMKSKTYFQS